MGTRKTLAISTITEMGRTEEKASIIFSFSILFTVISIAKSGSGWNMAVKKIEPPVPPV
jgi:hypothetical protein